MKLIDSPSHISMLTERYFFHCNQYTQSAVPYICHICMQLLKSSVTVRSKFGFGLKEPNCPFVFGFKDLYFSKKVPVDQTVRLNISRLFAPYQHSHWTRVKEKSVQLKSSVIFNLTSNSKVQPLSKHQFWKVLLKKLCLGLVVLYNWVVWWVACWTSWDFNNHRP